MDRRSLDLQKRSTSRAKALRYIINLIIKNYPPTTFNLLPSKALPLR